MAYIYQKTFFSKQSSMFIIINMRAVFSVTFNDEFVVHDLKVIESQNGLFIAMPSRKAPDGEFRDVAHPINPQMRERLHTIILQKYNESVTVDVPVDVPVTE